MNKRQVWYIVIIISLIISVSLTFIYTEKLTSWKARNCKALLPDKERHDDCLNDMRNSWSYTYASWITDIIFNIGGMRYN